MPFLLLPALASAPSDASMGSGRSKLLSDWFTETVAYVLVVLAPFDVWECRVFL